MVLILIFAEVLGLYGSVPAWFLQELCTDLARQIDCCTNYEHKSDRNGRLLIPTKPV